MEKSKKLDNLATVMTLYSRRTFSKESFQWTKCVVKYLMDTYTHLSIPVITFLVEVRPRGVGGGGVPARRGAQLEWGGGCGRERQRSRGETELESGVH